MAPSFVKKPQLRQEDDGNRLVFECKLAGSPKPDVTWFREDIKIQNDSRTTFKVTEEAKNTYAVILELNDVVETDAGLYKVKAKNKYGEVSASINLNFSREYFSCNILIVGEFNSFPLKHFPKFSLKVICFESYWKIVLTLQSLHSSLSIVFPGLELISTLRSIWCDLSISIKIPSQ